MKHIFLRRTGICFLLMLMIVFSHKAYSAQSQGKSAKPQSDITGPDISHFLVAVEDEPDTVDFQCTSIHYTIAQNVFNRLVETENDAKVKFGVWSYKSYFNHWNDPNYPFDWTEGYFS